MNLKSKNGYKLYKNKAIHEYIDNKIITYVQINEDGVSKKESNHDKQKRYRQAAIQFEDNKIKNFIVFLKDYFTKISFKRTDDGGKQNQPDFLLKIDDDSISVELTDTSYGKNLTLIRRLYSTAPVIGFIREYETGSVNNLIENINSANLHKSIQHKTKKECFLLITFYKVNPMIRKGNLAILKEWSKGYSEFLLKEILLKSNYNQAKKTYKIIILNCKIFPVLEYEPDIRPMIDIYTCCKTKMNNLNIAKNNI